MNLTYALYVLGLVGLCTCNSSPENALSKEGKKNGFTLDLTHPNRRKVFTSEATIGDATYKTFIAIVEETISKVLYDDKVVWEAGPEGNVTVVHLYSKNGIAHLIEVFRGTKANFTPLFFHKNGASWKSIPEKEFSTKVDALYDGKKNLVLDLSHPDKTKIFTSEADINGVFYQTFVTKDDETIAEVIHSGKTVWEAGSGKGADIVRIFSKGGEVRLIKLLGNLRSGFSPLFFHKNGASWKSIPEKEFSTKVDALYDGKKNGFTLDLMSPDKTKVFASEATLGRVTYKTFVAIVEETISKVVHSDETIWEAGPEGNVTVVHLYSKNGNARLVEVLGGPHSGFTPLFFECRNGSWFSVGRDYYYKAYDYLFSDEVLSSNKNAPGFTLDLTHPNRSEVFVSETTLGGVTYKAFFANVKETIDKVIYGNELVWLSSPGRRVSVVHFYSKGGHPHLVEVLGGPKDNFTSFFFECRNGKWISVDRDYYYNTYHSLLGENLDTDPGFTLDLLDHDKKNITVKTVHFDGAVDHTFSAKTPESISKVVYGDEPVWEAGTGKRVTVARLFFKSGYRLLELFLGPNSCLTPLFFEYQTNKWVPVDKEYYYKKHDGLFSEQTKFGFTVNLSNPDVSKVAIYEHNVNGVKYEHFILKYDLHVDHVVDNETSLWVSESGSRVTGIVKYSSYGRFICRLNVVDAKNKLTQQYFLKKDGQWKNIGFNTFFDKAKELVDTAAKNVKVDVLSPLPGITNTVYNYYGVETRRISPLNGFKIVSLHYGKELLWEGKNGEYCSSATFFEKDGVEIASVMVNDQEFFFEHADGSWVGTDAKTFQDSYLKMMGVVTPEPVKEVKVDVLSPLPGVTNTVYNYYGIETRRVSPVGDFKIVSLHYGKELLWEGATGQYLSSATFFEKDGAEIASLMTSEKEIFFEKVYGDWLCTDDKRFSEVYLKMMGVVTPEPVKEVDGTLDIAALPQETETYKPSEDSPYTFFVVSTGTPVIRVVDGPDTIWTGTNEQLCTASSFLSNGKKTLLAQIVVEGLVETNVLYFEKRTFKWHQITEALYDFKLEQLKVLKDGFLTNSLYTITLFVAIVSGITLL